MSGWRGCTRLIAGRAWLIAATGWHVVRPGERIVVRRFGRLVEPAWGPGLHWGLPLGLDRFDRVRTDEVRRLNVGTAPSRPRRRRSLGGRVPDRRPEPGADPGDRPVPGGQPGRSGRPGRGDVEALLGRLAEASLSRSLARRGIDTVLRGDRQRISDEVAATSQAAIARHRLGLSDPGREPDRRPASRRGGRRFRSPPSRRKASATAVATRPDPGRDHRHRRPGRRRQPAGSARAAAQRKQLASRAGPSGSWPCWPRPAIARADGPADLSRHDEVAARPGPPQDHPAAGRFGGSDGAGRRGVMHGTRRGAGGAAVE